MGIIKSHDGSGQDGFGAAPHERSVPRISIHAFCEFPDTGAALERAGADRRLAKAHLVVELGGLTAAIEHFHGQITPNLLIVETKLSGEAALGELDRLAEVCDPATKVVVVGRVNDVELYRALMQRGASEYLVAPLNPLQLIEVISGLYVNASSNPIGRVIAFFAARGGVGSSTLAHNVGWSIAEQFKINTTIVDLDLPFGTAGLNFNDESTQGVCEALSAPERLDDVLLDRLLLKLGDHLSLLGAPSAIDREYSFDSQAFESLIDVVRGSIPCVILDLPHVWAPWVKDALVAADDIVIVAAPDLACLRNTKNLTELLRHARPNDASPRIVLNQTGQPKRPEIPAKDFADTIGITAAANIAFDANLFGTATNNGQMLPEVMPKSPAAESVRMLAELLTGRTVQPARNEPTQIFSFLKGRKRA